MLFFDWFVATLLQKRRCNKDQIYQFTVIENRYAVVVDTGGNSCTRKPEEGSSLMWAVTFRNVRRLTKQTNNVNHSPARGQPSAHSGEHTTHKGGRMRMLRQKRLLESYYSIFTGAKCHFQVTQAALSRKAACVMKLSVASWLLHAGWDSHVCLLFAGLADNERRWKKTT